MPRVSFKKSLQWPFNFIHNFEEIFLFIGGMIFFGTLLISFTTFMFSSFLTIVGLGYGIKNQIYYKILIFLSRGSLHTLPVLFIIMIICSMLAAFFQSRIYNGSALQDYLRWKFIRMGGLLFLERYND